MYRLLAPRGRMTLLKMPATIVRYNCFQFKVTRLKQKTGKQKMKAKFVFPDKKNGNFSF